MQERSRCIPAGSRLELHQSHESRVQPTSRPMQRPAERWRLPRWLLTVKLRGRPEAPDQAPRAHNVFSARGADTKAVHGPLQRLLDDRPARTAANAPAAVAVPNAQYVIRLLTGPG